MNKPPTPRRIRANAALAGLTEFEARCLEILQDANLTERDRVAGFLHFAAVMGRENRLNPVLGARLSSAAVDILALDDGISADWLKPAKKRGPKSYAPRKYFALCMLALAMKWRIEQTGCTPTNAAKAALPILTRNYFKRISRKPINNPVKYLAENLEKFEIGEFSNRFPVAQDNFDNNFRSYLTVQSGLLAAGYNTDTNTVFRAYVMKAIDILEPI